jgi:hypothetical protein
LQKHRVLAVKFRCLSSNTVTAHTKKVRDAPADSTWTDLIGPACVTLRFSKVAFHFPWSNQPDFGTDNKNVLS